MICPRCRHKMKEEKRRFHKQHKWICPHCGRIRMQPISSRKPRTTATKPDRDS